MKLFFLSLFVLFSLFLTSAQTTISNNTENPRLDPFSIHLGVNAIDNSGERDPGNLFTDFSSLAKSIPIEVGVNYRYNVDLEFYAALTINRFKTGDTVDNQVIEENNVYSAVDVGARYSLWRTTVFNSNDELRLFVHGGAGVYNIKEIQLTGNIGFGGIYMINDYWGLYAQATGKFAFQEVAFQSSLFQYSVGVRIVIPEND